MEHFFSSGKILLTAEYVVLDGATAFAFPTKLGQSMWVSPLELEKRIHWKAYHQNKIWLDCLIDFQKEKIIYSNNQSAAEFVLKLIIHIKVNSKLKLKNHESYQIVTNLEFPSNYGLGSSSTLISNLAKWAQIDAFVMNETCLGGSGYDIAVALENKPISFQKLKNYNQINTFNWDSNFKKDLIFVHLNQKQDSREGIANYRNQIKSEIFINEMDSLSKEIVKANDLEKFSELMQIHENKLSSYLNIPTAKEKYFQDCPSFIKSLGAWGGDFILTTKFDDFEIFFTNKNFQTFFTWEDLINS